MEFTALAGADIEHKMIMEIFKPLENACTPPAEAGTPNLRAARPRVSSLATCRPFFGLFFS